METPHNFAGAFTELTMATLARKRFKRGLTDKLPAPEYNAIWEAVYEAASIHSPDRAGVDNLTQ